MREFEAEYINQRLYVPEDGPASDNSFGMYKI